MGSLVGRLKRRPEFLRVAATRRKWAAPGLVLQVAETSVPAPPPGGAAICGDRLRVGFTCSKKVGNAVARNRARRRLRAVAAALLPDMAAEGYDYVLIGRAETVRRPYTLLLQDLQTALKRVGALKNGRDMPARGENETG